MADEDADYFAKREAQELEASDNATDQAIKRLHRDMAQRYARLASAAEVASEGPEDVAALPAGTVSL